MRTTAEKLLGIEGNSSVLFRVEAWPAKLADAYRMAKSAKQRAALVGKRIDQFIAEHK